jgi:ribose transport system permease protein
MNIQTRFNNERVLLILKERYAFVLLIVLLIGFSVMDARFRTLDNYFVIGRQATIVAIVAISATFVISSKEIDLGVGAYASLISMAVSLLLLAGMNFLLASLIGVVIGMTVGFVNGLLTAKVGVPSFLGTLGMMGICDGLAKSLTD